MPLEKRLKDPPEASQNVEAAPRPTDFWPTFSGRSVEPKALWDGQ